MLSVNQINEYMIPNTVFVCQTLQFTVPVFVTLGAVGVMFRKQQFDNSFTSGPYNSTVGMDLHSLRYRGCTGCYKCPSTHLFNNANPAITCNAKVFVITKCWNPEIQFFAAARMVVPSGTETGISLIVRFTKYLLMVLPILA